MRVNLVVFFVLWMIVGAISNNHLFAQADKSKMSQTSLKAAPPTVVYKTRKDYSNYVPVILSHDKQHIVSYPDPKDINLKLGSNKPVKLKEGYLLDVRGIGPNVAYLKMTYAEYARLPQAPSLDEMQKMIMDKDPIVEMCNCGNRYTFKNVKNELNAIIQAKKLRTTCKVIK